MLDYTIFSDQGTGTWIKLGAGITNTEYIATSLTADTVYSFKIQARNAVGYSSDSDPVSIRAAAIPDTPTNPTNALNGIAVDFAWDPIYDGGSPILSYTVSIRESNEFKWTTDLVNCDGSDASILASRTCSIPASTLRSEPFNLAWGDSVYFKVTATNLVGTSGESQAGNGGILLTNPDAPLDLANDSGVTSAN